MTSILNRQFSYADGFIYNSIELDPYGYITLSIDYVNEYVNECRNEIERKIKKISIENISRTSKYVFTDLQQIDDVRFFEKEKTLFEILQMIFPEFNEESDYVYPLLLDAILKPMDAELDTFLYRQEKTHLDIKDVILVYKKMIDFFALRNQMIEAARIRNI